MDTVRINEKDNVCVNLATGHKIAVCDIEKGADIIKYGFPIGVATRYKVRVRVLFFSSVIIVDSSFFVTYISFQNILFIEFVLGKVTLWQ